MLRAGRPSHHKAPCLFFILCSSAQLHGRIIVNLLPHSFSIHHLLFVFSIITHQTALLESDPTTSTAPNKRAALSGSRLAEIVKETSYVPCELFEEAMDSESYGVLVKCTTPITTFTPPPNFQNTHRNTFVGHMLEGGLVEQSRTRPTEAHTIRQTNLQTQNNMKTNPQNRCKQQPTQTTRQPSKTATKPLRQEHK